MKKQLKKHFSFIIAVLMVISLIIIPRTAQAASVKLNKTKLTMNVGGVYHLKVAGQTKKLPGPALTVKLHLFLLEK